MCISNRNKFPPDDFTMTTISKLCRYGGNRLAIKSHQHALHRYSKSPLAKDIIFKLSVSESPLVIIY